jgi:type IV pilus assembly protein PilB
MAGLDIAEHRLPQDGRKKIKMNNREVDLRISILPTIFGEKIVIRLLDPTALFVNMSQLGFEDSSLEIYKRAITRSHGILLVTGPTGSGKTTTLYSTLDVLNDRGKNIVTIEDPVEYVLKGINQVQILADIGLTFSTVLRSILRQDPNIIMVGEIRDLETAQISINAALTGHLVLSTMHTNNTATTITRLLNLGIDAHLIASTLIMTMAQRLLRKVCRECKQQTTISYNELIKLGASPEMLMQQDQFTVYKPGRCNKCMNTGYKGRIGCYEVLEINDEIGKMISQNTNVRQVQDIALKNNMLTLRQSALTKFLKGITTLEEVLRVSDLDYA